MYKITSRWGHQSSISVMWNIGKKCNYDCSYCPSEIHDLHADNTKYEILKSTVDKLSEINKPIRIMFTGGEPTIHPEFSKLLEYISTKNISWTSVTTNGTKSVNWYLKNEHNWNHILFSLHFEFNWERVVHTIIQYSKESAKPFFVNVMMHHNYMNDVRSTVALFDEHNIKYAIRRIRWTDGDQDIFDDNVYSPTDLEWILENQSTAEPNCLIDDSILIHANDVIKNNQNGFNNWTCQAGLESLMINWDGEVHRATCRVGGSLGNIYNGTFVQPLCPITCTRNWCTCAADIYITKSNTQIEE